MRQLIENKLWYKEKQFLMLKDPQRKAKMTSPAKSNWTTYEKSKCNKGIVKRDNIAEIQTKTG